MMPSWAAKINIDSKQSMMPKRVPFTRLGSIIGSTTVLVLITTRWQH